MAPGVDTNITLTAVGGDVAAAEIGKGAQAIDSLGKRQDQLKQKFGQRFSNVGLQMFAQDAKKPAVLKQFMGMDVIGIGQWTIGHVFYKEDGTTAETPGYEYQAITEPGNLGPVELLCTRIGPHLQHQKDEPAELSSLMLHYESLGPV